jgi:hypothetical protein
VDTPETNIRVRPFNNAPPHFKSRGGPKKKFWTRYFWPSVDAQNAQIAYYKSIEKLNLIRTRVTDKGVQMALQYLPSLKSINHGAVMQVLADFAQRTLDDKTLNIPTYSLSEFTIFQSDLYTSGSFGLILNLCPLIVKIDLEVLEGFTNNDLLSLRFLKRLRELKLCDIYFNEESLSERSQITVDGGLFPLLKDIGSSLVILSLSCFIGLNVSLIAEFCPNLRSLTLHSNRFYTTVTLVEKIVLSNQKRLKIKPPILKHLIELRFKSNIFNNNCHLLAENMMLLFSSPSLRSVTFVSCNLITDEFLSDVANLNNFKNLKELELCHCPMITECGLGKPMKHSNNLEKVRVAGCDQLGKKIVENFKIQALKKNWKLSIVDSYR